MTDNSDDDNNYPTDLSIRSTALSSAHYHPTSDTIDLTGVDATGAGTTGYGTTNIADTGYGTATYGDIDTSGHRSSNTDTYGSKRPTSGYDTEQGTTSATDGRGGFDISALTSGTRGYTGSAYDAGRVTNVSSVRAGTGGARSRSKEGDTGFGYGSGWRNTFDAGNAGNTEKTGYGSRADYR